MNVCPKFFEDIWQAAMQEEECLKFEEKNVEINVGATFNKNKADYTDIAEWKSIFQASMKKSDKKFQEQTMQEANLTKLVNDNKTNTNNYTSSKRTQPQASGNYKNYTCYFCRKVGQISYCRQKLNKQYNQKEGNLNK